MSVVTISLVEDEIETASAVMSLLESTEDLRVVSHHETAEQILRELPQLRPQVVLVDLRLPGTGGVECIRRIKRTHPKILCLVLTRFDNDSLIFAALQAGADGYILKRSKNAEILAAIRCVIAGGGAMSPSVSRKVLEYFRTAKPAADAQLALSDREISLLQLARHGKRAKEIADAEGLSYQTVRTHFRNIYRKLHVHSLRTALDKTFEN